MGNTLSFSNTEFPIIYCTGTSFLSEIHHELYCYILTSLNFSAKEMQFYEKLRKL